MLIAGKYQLVKELGRGTMGSVWEAWHLSLRSPVAIKLMAPSIAASPTALQRFLREARAAAGLRSPHVVQILDHGVDHGLPYIVMEMLEGEALAERLARVGKLSAVETERIVTHIARALTRAQQAGITHRDLKPENVFIVRNDDEELVKVLDFGVAKVEHRFDGSFNEESTAAGALLGTPYYSSPEQAEGLKSVDHRTDIWSLGVMTYECLLGRRPFEGDTLPAVLLAISTKPLPVPSRVGVVPRGFDAWFAKACARNLTHRFAFAKDAAAELVKICSEHRAETERETVPKLAKLPPLAPLPTLPKLGADEDEDDEEDEAPTEIWRESSIAELVGLQKPISTLPPPPIPPSFPVPARPPLAPVKPALGPPLAPLATVAALREGTDARVEPKAAFSNTSPHRPETRGVRLRSQILLATLPALGVAAFAWFFYGERAASVRPLAPAVRSAGVAASAPGSATAVTAAAAPSTPSAPSAPAAADTVNTAPELMPTVDVNQLPVSGPGRGAARAGAAPAGAKATGKAGADSLFELQKRKPPKPAPQAGNEEDVVNPYR
jgi:serine/threonine protein kinase